MSGVLDQSLAYRQSHINTAKQYLQQTQTLFEQFGSQELKTSHAKFAELEKGLNSTDVQLVVIGEFSRGKSSLVNALLGIHLLRSAQEATTAINTFVKALPADCEQRFIRIHFRDQRANQDIAWTDEQVLERWGTELDTSNADARTSVDYIEIFTNHPLLEKGLVLIDTPGLQSVVQHHEEITRRAIAEAHIALWVQSTQQLGGNATEWAFLADTIQRNFRKFVTVVNMWDAVLDPSDPQERAKPESLRCRDKLNRVKENFRKNLHDSAEVEVLTNSEHLMGVSALWALSGDEQKIARSGIDRLAERLSDMLTNGEALEQIYLKPLQQLSNIQQQLADGLQDELQQLGSNASLEERQRELKLFDEELKNLQLDMRTTTQESQSEHERAAKNLADKIEQQLITPLTELRDRINERITKRYVETLVNKKARQIALPEDLQQEFQQVSTRVWQRWNECKSDLLKTLANLRVDYNDQMQRHVGQLSTHLSSVEIELPELNIHFNLDLSAMEHYHQQVHHLDSKRQQYEAQLDELEQNLAKNAANETAIMVAREAVQRAHAEIGSLGVQPEPRNYSETHKVSDGGAYSGPEYETVTHTDFSNVDNWKTLHAELSQKRENKEQYLKEIVEEEQRKTGVRMSLQTAQRKYEKELEKLERAQKRMQEQAQQERTQLVDEMLEQLRRRTTGQLEQRIHYLQHHTKSAIHKLFNDQLELLTACVREQFLEPINAKRTKREEIQSLIQQGEAQITQRRVALDQALSQLQELQQLTYSALNS